VAATGENKLLRPDGVPDEILKLGGETMKPCLVRLVDIKIINATKPRDWKRAIAFPVCKRKIAQY
jgi:hypothetical protein